MKIVINRCWGGFGLSHEAVMRYAEIKGMALYPWIDAICKKVYKEKATFDNPSVLIHYTTVSEGKYQEITAKEQGKPIGSGRFDKSNSVYFSARDIERTDPILIQVVNELSDKANGCHAELEIIEIPDDVVWEIDEYDGIEHIAEKHKTWG